MNTRNDDGRAVVEFVVGGCAHSFVAASDADVVVVVDSQDETSRVPDLPNIIKVPLGDHETVLMLLERLAPGSREAAAVAEEYHDHRRPNVDLSSGMAQDPRLGAFAVRDVASRGELEKIFEQVRIRLLEATNGRMPMIEVRELNSNAGGMGSGGAPEIGSLFLDYAERHTSATFRHHMLRIGGLTFAAIAPKALDNTGRVTGSNVEQLLGSSHARRTRSLELYELPLRDEDGCPVRDHREQRGLLAGTLLQARFAPAVAMELEDREVNHRSASQLGEILRLQASWSQCLDQSILIRAAATRYRDRLKAARTTPEKPSAPVALTVEVEMAPIEGALPNGEDVMRAIQQKDPARFVLLDRIRQAEPPRLPATVLLVVTPGQAASVDQVLGAPERPRNWSEAQSVAARYRGVVDMLEAAHGRSLEAERKAQAQFARARARLTSEIRNLRSWWYPIEGFLLTNKRVSARAKVALDAFCQSYRQCSEALSRKAALEGALDAVKRGLAAHVDLWFGRMERALDELLEGRGISVDTAEFRPLDAVYSQLLDATLEAGENSGRRDGMLRSLLIRAVERITPQGLAAMLGTDADPLSIVAAIENNTSFPWKAPLWGGETAWVDPRHRFVVLPPVGADLDALRQAAAHRGFHATLATAGSVAAGCCVVDVAVYPVTQREEVLARQYQKDAPDAGDQAQGRIN